MGWSVKGPSASLLLIVLICSSQGSQAVLSWSSLVPALTDHIKVLWQNNELEFMGYQCIYMQRPTFYRWELYYIGTFMCPTWNNIRGRSRTRSVSGVVTNSITDYINKVRQRNLITEDEASVWLAGFSDD